MKAAALGALAIVAVAAPSASSQVRPTNAAQATGPYTGVAIGVLDRYRHIESSFTSDSTDYYRGRFTFSFSIDAAGNVRGRGDGSYLNATWHLEGVNGSQGAFSCDVPMFTQPFTVSVAGTATSDTITLRFAMEGSRERNDDYPCGANFTGFATDSTRLADSLQLVQQPNGIRISRSAQQSGVSERRIEVLGDARDRRVNVHEWAFTFAGPGAPPPPEPPGGGGGAGTPGGPPTPIQLVGTVGPGARISLTLDGRPVTILPSRAYRILVRDRSRRHNFHLTGPGVNRTTQVRRTGSSTWNVSLRAGNYRYQSDPDGPRLRRTVLVR